MSMSIASTQALINLLETGIISQPYFDEFYQQTCNLKDDEDIANAIDTWLKSQNNNQVIAAYQNQLNQLNSFIALDPGKTLGMGGSKSLTPAGQPNPTNRELLDNAMIKIKPQTDNNNSQSQS